MKPIAIMVSLSALMLISCDKINYKPEPCEVPEGAKVVWKEPDNSGRYSSYPLLFKTSESDKFCRVDNKDLYGRVTIGDKIPWKYSGVIVTRK